MTAIGQWAPAVQDTEVVMDTIEASADVHVKIANSLLGKPSGGNHQQFGQYVSNLIGDQVRIICTTAFRNGSDFMSDIITLKYGQATKLLQASGKTGVTTAPASQSLKDKILLAYVVGSTLAVVYRKLSQSSIKHFGVFQTFRTGQIVIRLEKDANNLAEARTWMRKEGVQYSPFSSNALGGVVGLHPDMAQEATSWLAIQGIQQRIDQKTVEELVKADMVLTSLLFPYSMSLEVVKGDWVVPHLALTTKILMMMNFKPYIDML